MEYTFRCVYHVTVVECSTLAHIPTNVQLIRFAPRELEDQILYRRQQPGVVYPKASECVMSKLLTVENVSFYTDLDADAYWIAPSTIDSRSTTMENSIGAALLSSPESNSSDHKFTHEDALKCFKERLLKPFIRDQRNELVFVRVLWIKLDFVQGKQNPNERGGSAKPVLAAVDITTEEIELNLDFDQIAVILEELEHVVDYLKRARTWQWRPSCIDRERNAPPNVKVLPNALLPLPVATDEDRASITFSIDKQRKSKHWFRAMWRYAFHCVVDQLERSRNKAQEETPKQEIDPRLWWKFNDFDDPGLHEARRQRYIHLYARSLSPAAMEVALYGRGAALLGLKQDQPGVVPEADIDQFSADSPRRRPLPEFEPLTQEEEWELSDFVITMPVFEQRVCRALAEKELRRDFTSAPPSPTRKVSSAIEFSVAPSDSAASHASHHSRSFSVDESAFSSGLQFTPPFSEERRQIKRGSTIGTAELASRPASPPTSRPHAASTSDLPSPTKHENALDLEPLRAWIYKQRKLGLYTTSWFEKQFLPASLLNPFKVIPLLNWQIGPVTLRLCESNYHGAQKPKRSVGVEIGIESCSGAILIRKTPYLRILMETRVGLFQVTLVRQSHLTGNPSNVELENTITEYKWISSDYIRSPEDGFFYVGLKYSAKEVTANPSGRVQFVGNLEEELGLKGRMCIGPIKIDCNEAAMRIAMGQTIADELQTLTEQDKAGKADQRRLEKSAKRTRMLHALLLRSSTFEVEIGTLELNFSTYTSHIEKALRLKTPKAEEPSKSFETREDVNVMLPTTTYRLQNRPSMNECIVDVAGARVVYRSTKQGRAAVIRHLAQLFNL
ncbi:unnamed protein product [Phytophthora lilii]|uniref:Unnamed protein product n=1 Tax=Phytophthora lilii TaxID=2077276 RepID=A0A9W6X218_9STRA|nr:unnamed protein product [Phytophthora lilii]